jgi:hypothetical protein
VRRRAVHQRAVSPDQQIAVADAGVELEGAAAQFGLQGRDAAAAFLRRDVAGGVVLHNAVVDGDEVAAIGDIARAEVDADVGGLQRATPAVDGRRVVAQHGQIGDVAARRHALRHGAHQTHGTGTRQLVHVRGVRDRQRRAPAELRNGIVGHAVRYEQDAFGDGGLVHPAFLNRGR